jgi:Xaa-Pro aminopeptidase
MSRIKQVLNEMKNNDLDGLFLITDPNIRYISGFIGSESFVLITIDRNYFITDGRYIEQAEKECPEFEVLEWKKTDLPVEKVLNDLAVRLKLKKIGFEQDYLAYEMFRKLKNSLTGAEFIPIKDIVEKIRYVKDEEEISNINRAAEFADLAFDQILGFVKPGLTEKRVTCELEYYIRKSGSDGIGFPTILVSGVNTSLPHGIPSDKVIEEGDFITLDFGGIYHGYHSDMTRTIIVGKADDEQKRIYNIVKEAQLAALEIIKAGIGGIEPDSKARAIFSREGLEDKFRHELGHGVGLQIHENPYMGKTSKDILEENCIITVEPGLYIPGWGGVRIEDTAVVKKDGMEILTKSSKELIEL